MKKNIALFILALVFSFFSNNIVSAGDMNYSNTSTSYYTPNYTPELSYSVDGNYINFEWSQAKDEEFRYYKLVHSATNSNLNYPNGTTRFVGITTNDNANKVKHLSGHWRVCHVFKGYYEQGEDTKYTTCSNVVSLKENTNTSDNHNKKTTLTKNTSNSLSSEYKKKSDTLILNFKKKLDSSSLSNEEKAKKISAIITKLEVIKKSKPALSSLINYLVLKLDELEASYNNDFESIESLFDLSKH